MLFLDTRAAAAIGTADAASARGLILRANGAKKFVLLRPLAKDRFVGAQREGST